VSDSLKDHDDPIPLSLHPSLEPFAREWLGLELWSRFRYGSSASTQPPIPDTPLFPSPLFLVILVRGAGKERCVLPGGITSG